MSETKPLLIPFADEVTFRASAEKFNDEVYRSIPALNSLAASILTVTNKLSQEARDALLLEDGMTDPTLRELKVEIGMAKRHLIENAQPDLDYLQGQAPVSRRTFESADKDIWLEP